MKASQTTTERKPPIKKTLTAWSGGPSPPLHTI